MKVVLEKYRGIEYIQISTLPQDQKNEILKSISQKSIIKILKNDSLLKDCVQYEHYESWFENVFSKIRVLENKTVEEPTLIFKASNLEQILSTK